LKFAELENNAKVEPDSVRSFSHPSRENGNSYSPLIYCLLPMVRRLPGYRQNVLGSEICLPDGLKSFIKITMGYKNRLDFGYWNAPCASIHAK
jgi:hypothetical protein